MANFDRCSMERANTQCYSYALFFVYISGKKAGIENIQESPAIIANLDL